MVLFSSFLGLFGFKWTPKGYQKVPPRPHLNLSTSQKEYGCIQAHFLANLVHSSRVKWTPMVTHRSHYVSTWVTQPLTRKMAVLSPFPSRFESFSGQMDPNSSSWVIPPLKTKMALFSTFGVVLGSKGPILLPVGPALSPLPHITPYLTRKMAVFSNFLTKFWSF